MVLPNFDSRPSRQKRLVTILDVDHGQGKYAISVLQRAGIKGFSGHSPYVGSIAIRIKASGITEIRKALRVLKDQGLIDDIGFQLQMIRQNMSMGNYT